MHCSAGIWESWTVSSVDVSRCNMSIYDQGSFWVINARGSALAQFWCVKVIFQVVVLLSLGFF